MRAAASSLVLIASSYPGGLSASLRMYAVTSVFPRMALTDSRGTVRFDVNCGAVGAMDVHRAVRILIG